MTDPAVAELFAQFAQISDRVPALRDSAVRELVAEFAVTTLREIDLIIDGDEMDAATRAYNVAVMSDDESPSWFEQAIGAALAGLLRTRWARTRG